VLTAGGVGGGGLYLLVTRNALSSQHSVAFTTISVIGLVAVVLLLIVMLVALMAWVWLFWRAGQRSIETIESHADARETFIMLGTLLLQFLRPASERSREDRDKEASGEAPADRGE
jgi:hypothetical protein